ncbi:hypothetical protein GYMLUDRAFT_42029 [Collybiopsis luxurians FD-317 M1]|uniref:Uncharacterized protein n=1 Tax=Collybiopsis luxurians FD-317 M1 TaxID=944289 RepID=A0A0D0BFF1_9AGAR|nr:hypothetical protein GYMLUDRAFT_42029 [Collybiopsis luxurians FD-317 M1]
MFRDRPIATFVLSPLVLSAMHGSLAVPTPDDFTFVAHETDIPIVIDVPTTPVSIATATGPSPTTALLYKNPPKIGPISITTIMVPIGTASGANPATTYLYKEVQEYPLLHVDIYHSAEPFTTDTVTALGTLVASPSGYVLSAGMHGGGSDLTANIECHYINSVEEECVLNADLYDPVTTRRPIFTLLSGSAPTTVHATSVPNTD